jgi:hypothetical protein
VAEETDSGAGEDQPLAIDERVLGLPPLLEHERKRVTDPEGEDGDERSENGGTKVGAGTAVEGETCLLSEVVSGVGKASAASALHALLKGRDIRHAVIEGDYLDLAHPEP